MEATAEIPKVQFAKVGEKREKKKGGLPLWLRGAKAGGSFSGAVGGEGAAGGGSFLGSLGALGGEGGSAQSVGWFMRIFPKFLMASIIASFGIGVYGLKTAMSPQSKKPFAARPKKIFDSPAAAQKYSGDLSSLPGGRQADQSGLSMVRGSLDDGSANSAQSAQPAQAAQAAGSQSAQPAAPATPDAAAIAAAAAAAAGAGAGAGPGAGNSGKNGPFAARFGQLTSSFDGGGSFSSGGMFGGVGSPFSGKLSALSSQAPVARAAAPSSQGMANPASRLAARQLNNAFLGGRAAQASMANGTSMESASYKAAQPFDNGGSAQGIVQGPTGSATPQGGAGAAPGSPDSTNSSGGGYDSDGPSAGGTPQNPMTDCVQLLGPTYTNTSNGGCIQTTASPTDSTPWGAMGKIAGVLLMLASALLLAAIVLAHTANGITMAVAQWLGGIAAALGAIVALIGASIISMGQTLQGTIFTVGGAAAVLGGVIVAVNPFHTQWLDSSIFSTADSIAATISATLSAGAGLAGALE